MSTVTTESGTRTAHCGCGAVVTGARDVFLDGVVQHRDCGIGIIENHDRAWIELTVYVGLRAVAWAWPSPGSRSWEVKQCRIGDGVDTITVGSRKQAEVALQMLATAFAIGTGR